MSGKTADANRVGWRRRKHRKKFAKKKRYSIPAPLGQEAGSTRLKVMLFSHICGGRFITGAEKYLSLLAKELSPHADCTLVVPEDGILKREAETNGIRTVIEPFFLLWSIYRPDGELERTEASILAEGKHAMLIQLLQLYRPDIVIVNSCVNALPAMAAKSLGIPVVWLMMEKIHEHSAAQQSAHMINRYSDLIVGVSNHSLILFREFVPDGKLMLLPPSSSVCESSSLPQANEELKKRFRFPDHKHLIGYISAGVQREKGLEHFLLMALQLCAEQQDLCFIGIASPAGDADYERYCRSLVEQSEFRDRFRLLGFQPDIESMYPLMDVVVVPSLIDEGFGMIALEALLFGIKTVVYRSGGLEEVLTAAGQESMLVDKGDIGGLAAKVKEGLLTQPADVDVDLVTRIFGMQAYRVRLASFLSMLGLLAARANMQRAAAHIRPLKTGRLYRGNLTPSVYLLELGRKRPFTSPEAFRRYGFRLSDVYVVPERSLYAYPVGTEIRQDRLSYPPLGRVIRKKRGKRRGKKIHNGKPARRFKTRKRLRRSV
ncbi:glycosyltransferase [Paenibacillus sp. OV219]|uniref:glycosyltransferase n=1 Tax=Paenibacillus sp. OV219 TaxID=1884377 RepID=UPI0008B77759|nr:glycosyltransferase [Paenibacillus sp. OV219]SEN04441.1 Glycosyltransferase involved in cell wall bisynthesis [Paenibacillus sp. OV219]